MRRWLAVLLLVLLPLQFSWAAVASYCLDGSATLIDASTPGHDVHHGHDRIEATDSGQDAPAAEAHSTEAHDCGHCHGHGAGLVQGTADAAGPVRCSGLLATAPPQPPEPSLTRPERPQWPPSA